MQDLTPAGLTEDGTCLLLVTARGERFRLPVDDQLQRLVGSPRRLPAGTGARSGPEPAAAPEAQPEKATPTFESRRPHQQEHTMDSALRPRDIQARIRSGESAETVAAAAGTSVEAIMPFAAPVLAERAHQAQTALRASVRRGAGQSTGARTLGDAVAQYLSSEHLQDDDVAWDSWRRPDGRWALTARVEAGDRALEAELLHDVAGRYVVAENDDARVLTGEARPAGATGVAATAPEPGPRRLSAVGPQAVGPDPDRDVLGDPDRLGEDAIALVRDRRDEPTVLGGDPLPASSVPAPEPEPETARDDSEETQELDTREEAPPSIEATEATESAESAEAEDQDGAEDGEQPELDLGVPEEDKPRRGRRGRSSVPSWDEIMFGGGPGKD